MEDAALKAFIKACKKVNPTVDSDSAYRAYKVVQGNLKIRIAKELKDASRNN